MLLAKFVWEANINDDRSWEMGVKMQHILYLIQMDFGK